MANSQSDRSNFSPNRETLLDPLSSPVAVQRIWSSVECRRAARESVFYIYPSWPRRLIRWTDQNGWLMPLARFLGWSRGSTNPEHESSRIAEVNWGCNFLRSDLYTREILSYHAGFPRGIREACRRVRIRVQPWREIASVPSAAVWKGGHVSRGTLQTANFSRRWGSLPVKSFEDLWWAVWDWFETDEGSYEDFKGTRLAVDWGLIAIRGWLLWPSWCGFGRW